MNSLLIRTARVLGNALRISGQGKEPSSHTLHPALQEGEESWQVHDFENIRIFNDVRAFAAFNSDQSLIPELFCFLRPEMEINEYIKQSKQSRSKYFEKSVLSLYSSFSRRNYFHWLFDVLPRVHLFRTACPGVSPDCYLFPGSLDPAYRTQTLDLLGIPASQRVANTCNPHWICKKIYITDHPRSKTVTSKPPVREWNCRFLRETFLPFAENKTSLPKRIYITRNDANTARQVVNEKELLKILSHHDIQPVVLSKLCFTDQLSLFAHADLVIGVHGAGFANTVFCQPGTRVMEMINANYTWDAFASIAGFCGLRYLQASQKGFDPDVRPLEANITVDLPDFENKLESFFSV